MRITGFFFVVAAAVLASASHASEPAVAAVLRADAERLAAMMAGDGAALSRLMSDALVFVHSDGRIESKAEYVKNMTAGDTAYTNAKTSDLQTLKPSSDVIVLIGTQDMRKKLGDSWSDIHLKFMSIWRNENGTWRMYAWQSMKPSGSSVVPAKK
jgi:ketosteroid isomerase-like protein